jgi:hypothetical protein
MKNQSKCEYINLNDPEVMKRLLQDEGEFKRGCNLPKSNRNVLVKVRWNKNELVFKCSIVFLEKGKCVMRFDDEHECRHGDVNLHGGRTKIISGQFAQIKVECPILAEIINSLPKDKADAWKIKLFDEIVIGNQKWKEYLNNPKRVHF